MARQHNEFHPDTLERVVEEARRARIFKLAHDAYAALAADPQAYAEWRAEFEAWHVTVADGLEPESFSARSRMPR